LRGKARSPKESLSSPDGGLVPCSCSRSDRPSSLTPVSCSGQRAGLNVNSPCSCGVGGGLVKTKRCELPTNVLCVGRSQFETPLRPKSSTGVEGTVSRKCSAVQSGPECRTFRIDRSGSCIDRERKHPSSSRGGGSQGGASGVGGSWDGDLSSVVHYNDRPTQLSCRCHGFQTSRVTSPVQPMTSVCANTSLATATFRPRLSPKIHGL